MPISDWLLGGGLVLLIGLVAADFRETRAMRQVLLGYEGKRGMMDELALVQQELRGIRDDFADMERRLRDEIAGSRHTLRGEFTLQLARVDEEMNDRIAKLEGRIRDIELRRVG